MTYIPDLLQYLSVVVDENPAVTSSLVTLLTHEQLLSNS